MDVVLLPKKNVYENTLTLALYSFTCWKHSIHSNTWIHILFWGCQAHYRGIAQNKGRHVRLFLALLECTMHTNWNVLIVYGCVPCQNIKWYASPCSALVILKITMLVRHTNTQTLTLPCVWLESSWLKQIRVSSICWVNIYFQEQLRMLTYI